MALFVVACGVLLMVGGAISFLLGFDIVLTERGAAMTIGGVVALTGGVIAVGIGFALVRLNQILRSLEARAGKPVRSQAPDRPVLPIVPEAPPSAAGPSLAVQERAAPEAMTSSASAAAAEPTPIAPPPMPPVAPPRIPVAAAGLAAGAAFGAAATIFGRSGGDRAEASAGTTETTTTEATTTEAEGTDAVLSGDMADPEPSESASESAIAMPEVATRIPPVPLDLEEELSRALEEPVVPREVEPASPPLPLDEDRSFEDGLSQLLGRRARPIVGETAPKQDLADLMSGLGAHPPMVVAPAQEPSAAETEPGAGVGEPDHEPAPSAVEHESLEGPGPEVDAGPAAADFDASSGAVRDGVGALGKNPWRDMLGPESDAAAPPAAPDEHMATPPSADDEDLFAAGEPTSVDVATSATSGDGAPEASASRMLGGESMAGKSPVLGTYTIDGRTYSMFADGSVEAVNELGQVERFASMNELRRYLAGG